MIKREGIPGYKEIIACIEAWKEWDEAFEHYMTDGADDGVGPGNAPSVTPEELMAQYPLAAAVLKYEREEERHLHVGPSKALETLLSGGSLEEANAAYEEAHEAFIRKHIWD